MSPLLRLVQKPSSPKELCRIHCRRKREKGSGRTTRRSRAGVDLVGGEGRLREGDLLFEQQKGQQKGEKEVH